MVSSPFALQVYFTKDPYTSQIALQDFSHGPFQVLFDGAPPHDDLWFVTIHSDEFANVLNAYCATISFLRFRSETPSQYTAAALRSFSEWYSRVTSHQMFKLLEQRLHAHKYRLLKLDAQATSQEVQRALGSMEKQRRASLNISDWESRFSLMMLLRIENEILDFRGQWQPIADYVNWVDEHEGIEESISAPDLQGDSPPCTAVDFAPKIISTRFKSPYTTARVAYSTALPVPSPETSPKLHARRLSPQPEFGGVWDP